MKENGVYYQFREEVVEMSQDKIKERHQDFKEFLQSALYYYTLGYFIRASLSRGIIPSIICFTILCITGTLVLNPFWIVIPISAGVTFVTCLAWFYFSRIKEAEIFAKQFTDIDFVKQLIKSEIDQAEEFFISDISHHHHELQILAFRNQYEQKGKVTDSEEFENLCIKDELYEHIQSSLRVVCNDSYKVIKPSFWKDICFLFETI